MKYKSIIYRVGALTLMTLCATGVYAQKAKALKTNEVPVSFQLVDENGAPVENAQVIIGEGNKYLQADANGLVSVSMNPNFVISVKEPGYEKVTFKIADIEEGKYELQSSLYGESFDDVVSLPFTNTTKRAATGDYIVITGEDLQRYPTLDLRTALSTLAPGLVVTENNGATGSITNRTGGRASLSMRGSGPVYYIDDALIDLNDMTVDVNEVESVTIIKDIVGKAKFGPRAASGIVYIRTKRGAANERNMTVSVEKGVQMIDRMPTVASAADYARMNNLARENSGMLPLYTDDAITEYAKGDPNNLVFPANDFMSVMFTDLKSYDKYSVATSGGNNFAQYYANVAYRGEGDNFAMGEKSDYKDIAFRSNLTMKLNDIVSVDVGLFGDLKLRNSPHYSNASLEFVSALGNARSINPVAFPAYLPIETGVGNPVYGVSEEFGTNPIAKLEGGGYHLERGRTGSVNAALNFDLDALVEGLSSKTYINLSTYNQTRIGKANSFDSRLVAVSSVDTTYTTKSNYSIATSETKRNDHFYQYFYGFEQINYARQFGDHKVNADAIFSMMKQAVKGVTDPYTEQNLNFAASYSYKDKYYVDLAVSHAGSMALIGDNKFKTFPTVGAAWLVSEESFMDDVKFIDFLKIRAQGGMLGFTTDNPANYRYLTIWQTDGSVNFGPESTTDSGWMSDDGKTTSVNTTSYSILANQDLDWEVRKEYSVGIDAVMFNNKLSFTANYYNNLRDGMWTTVDNGFPLMSGLLAYPMTNYNTDRYYGAEVYGSYTDKIGDLTYSIGASAVFNRSKRLVYDEVTRSAENEHLYRVGKSTSVQYAYIFDGTYATDAEAQAVEQSFDTNLIAGDFKYRDFNNDGVLDGNDQVALWDSAPDVYYTANLSLGYKNFELHVTADGKAGYQMMANGNSYFTSGAGDNNYSQYIVDAVDAGNYPRLTYNEVNNNFQASEYWLLSRDYFKIQNVELAYNLSTPGMKNSGIRKVRFFLRAANLCTLSGLQGIDPESTSAGVSAYPLNTTYTGGFNITF